MNPIMIPPDIEKKIGELFGEQAVEARKIIEKIVDPKDQNDRVVRCVLVLSGGSLKSLAETATIAAEDFRDVISGAEYDKAGNRIANYNNPF